MGTTAHIHDCVHVKNAVSRARAGAAIARCCGRNDVTPSSAVVVCYAKEPSKAAKFAPWRLREWVRARHVPRRGEGHDTGTVSEEAQDAL